MENIGDWLNLIFLFFLLAFSAFNFASEISIIALSKIRLKSLAEKGDPKARAISKIIAHPEKLFGTILVANNLVTILAGSIATIIAVNILGEIGIIPATIIVTVLITIGDVLAKTYSAKNPEQVSYLTLRPLQIIMFILSPFVKLFALMTNFIIIGIAYTKHLLAMSRHAQVLILEDCISEPYFISENTRIINLLIEFQKSKVHIGIVRNERQNVVGLIALDDLFEEIVGEILPEHIK